MCSLFSGNNRKRFDQFGEEGLKQNDGQGNGYSFNSDAREMFEEMKSKLGENFVEIDGLSDGSFGGYMKPRKSDKSDCSEVEEVDITASVFMDVGGPKNGGAKKSAPPVRQDPPVEHTLKLTLEELFSGCTKKMKITRKVLSETGNVSKEGKVITVEVRPGWKPGTKVTFPREGDQALGRHYVCDCREAAPLF